jgi:hypothetical protein
MRPLEQPFTECNDLVRNVFEESGALFRTRPAVLLEGCLGELQRPSHVFDRALVKIRSERLRVEWRDGVKGAAARLEEFAGDQTLSVEW